VKKVKYNPFTTDYTPLIIDDMKEYLKRINNSEATIDTLDLCHLIGEIERLHYIIKEVREEIIKDRKKNYDDLGKKAFYCNKTDKLLKILGSDKE
jgi:hypothetical protein